MKKMKLAVLAITLVSMFGAGNVLAADAAEITVTAEIVDACSIEGSSDIAFGAIDPLTASDPITPETAGSVTVVCTEGTSVTFSTSNYLAMTGTAATPLPYTPIIPNAAQTPGFTGGTYTITAQIALTDAQAAEAASDYSGSFTVNIIY